MRATLVMLASLLPFAATPALAAPETEACFREAAARWKLPSGLLESIARAESGGFHNVPEADDHSGHNHQKLYGLMGLRDDQALGHSLREAAAASGLPLERVVQDPCANIEAAAALLGAELASGGTVEGAVRRSWGASNGAAAIALYRSSEEGLTQLAGSDPKAAWCWRFWTDCDGNPAPAPAEPLPPQGQGGEFPGSEWDRSANYDAGQIKPRFIVLHTTEGNFNGAVSWLKNKKSGVSAHYVVRAGDGYVKQLVRERDQAWHARCWNDYAIGIEMEGFHKNGSSFTGPLVRSAAALVKYLSRKYGIAPDATRVVGHDAEERGMLKAAGLEDCNDHGDPGKFFDWGGFWRLLR